MNLTDTQKTLLKDYGEDQILHMFETHKALKTPPPIGSKVIGMSCPFGLWTCIDENKQKRYSYRAEGWVEATDYINPGITYDKYEDLVVIYSYLKINS